MVTVTVAPSWTLGPFSPSWKSQYLTMFKTQMGNFPRTADVEANSGLRSFYNLARVKLEKVKFPDLTFHFKGGAVGITSGKLFCICW